MKRDLRLSLQDVVDSIDKIEEYTKGVSEDSFYENSQVQDAVLRRLEIIGEAVKHIPKRCVIGIQRCRGNRLLVLEMF